MLTKHYCFPSGTAQTAGKGRYTFIDIETTGLKRDATILYLIGCGWHENDDYHIIQWFNDDGVSEPAMLLALQDFLSGHPAPLLTFNGESFDIPYLNRHYELNNMDFRLNLTGSLDLYRMLRPFQTLFRLPHGKQKDWEHFLGIDREDLYSGGQLIGMYKQYLIKKDPGLLDILLLHNMEDIRGMEALLPLASYQGLMNGAFSLREVSCSASFTAFCQLKAPLPRPLQITVPIGSLDISGDLMKLSVPVTSGSLKYFYPDYRNYYYLPEEDRAIHKSVGCYVDSRFREKAKPATCYIRKTGHFVPLFPDKKYKGIQTSQKSYADSLTLYKNNYRDKHSFVELDVLLSASDNLTAFYLCDYLKHIFIADMKKAATKQ